MEEKKLRDKGAIKLSVSVLISFLHLSRYQQNKPRSSRGTWGWNICAVHAARWYIGIRRWKRSKADILEWKLPKTSQNWGDIVYLEITLLLKMKF